MRRPLTGLLAGLMLLAAALAASGCRSGSFLGGRYNNFRAYYNTFYNARKSFEEGEEQLLQLDQRVDRSRYLPLFADLRMEGGAAPGGGSSGPFQDAIDRSADLLRERPTSKWADDALLLIGKAYFYQREWTGAEQKFHETIAAAEARGRAALTDEARFWIGRTLAAQERYDEAAAVLEEGLAREGLSRHWRARMQLALAEQFVQQRAWDAAAAALTDGLTDLREPDLAGRAYFLLGQVEETRGHYDAAAAAYAAVEEHRPYYELAYAAQLSHALALGLDAGRPDEALALVRRMRRDDKHFQNRAEVDLAYARLLAAAGRPGEARERFEALLYGDEFEGVSVPRSEAYFHYGAFYRDGLDDYVRAAAYFDTAATGQTAEAGREALRPRAALTDVREQAEAFRAYAGIATRLAEADSLLTLGALDDDAYAARVAEVEAARRQAWEEEQRRLARLRAQRDFAGTPIAGGGSEFPGDPDEGRDPGDPSGTVDAGFLNYRDVARLQDAVVGFQAVWGDRPLVPNWRRRQAIGGAVVTNESDFGPQGSAPTGRGLGGPAPLDWSTVPRTSEARTALLTARAGLRYELGNVLLLALAQPDSAAYWYNLVVEEGADVPVAARALYALAEARREQGRTADAEPLYRRLLEATPEGDLADQARERLGLPPREQAATQDTTDLATAAYEAAYARWRANDYPAALQGFLGLADTYRETDQAPRALLAAAAAFVEWAQRDSVDVEDGLPAPLVPPSLLDTTAEAAGEPDSSGAVPDQTSSPPVLEDEPDEVPDEVLPRPLDEETPAAVEDAPRGAPAPPGPEPPGAPGAADEAGRSAPADSVTADSSVVAVAVTDSASAPAFGLLDLYRIVEARYPQTPYAERAQALRQAFQEVNGLPSDGPVEPVVEGEGDDTPPVVGLPAAPADAALPPEIAAALPAETFGMKGETPLVSEVGGYAWRVAAVPEPRAALTLLRTHAGRGLRAAVVEEEGESGPQYALLVGQFASVADAGAARDGLPSAGVGTDARVVALAGLALLDQDDLLDLAEGDLPADDAD